MKVLFWSGLVVLILGLASLFVPITHHERQGITAGGMSVGMDIQHDEKVSPLVSGAMIVAGAGMMISAKAARVRT